MSRYKQPYSLYKRGKYWYYRTYTPDGVRTTAKTTGQTSKNAAKEYCDRLFLQGFLFRSSVTFRQYAEHFYDDDGLYFKDRVEELSFNTRNNYRKMMKNIVMPYFENKQLSDIDYVCLKSFRASLMDKYAPKTIGQAMSTLKHIIDAAYKSRKIIENPYNFLETLKMKDNERDAYTLSEVKMIYKKIDEEFKQSVLFLALTGVRISECMGMVENKIIQADGFEYIDLKCQFTNKKYTQLKGKQSRPIPIIPEIKELKICDQTRLSAFYREVTLLKNECLKDTPDRNLSAFHSFRHFFITNAKSKNITESKVEYIAGHTLKDIKKTYTNFKAEDLTDILNWQKITLDAILK